MARSSKSFYLTRKDAEDIKKAKTLYELTIVGHRILDRMEGPVVQVCGPISTGGDGSVKENINTLAEAIKVLSEKGLNIFNQLPFERAFDRIMRSYKISGYDTPILEEFYGPIFESGKTTLVYFLPGWRKSVGARWEYNYAKKLGIKRIILPKGWMNLSFPRE